MAFFPNETQWLLRYDASKLVCQILSA